VDDAFFMSPMDRASFLFVMAFGMTLWFIVGQIANHGHPGGEVLGFAGAIWCAWQNETNKVRRQRRIARRRRIRKLAAARLIGEDGELLEDASDTDDDDEDEDVDA
jgi:hypothetical protein